MLAAQIALAGMNPLRFLHSKDSGEREIMQAIASTASDILDKRDRNLAVHIANKVGELFAR